MHNKSFIAFILLIVIVVLTYNYQVRWTGWNQKQWENTINADGIGYYEYLRAVFIYHDLQYNYLFEQGRYRIDEEFLDTYLLEHNGQRVNKYFVGTAILIAPFFLLAYILSIIFSLPLDGYSLFFQISVSIAALFYLILGLIYIFKLLKTYSISFSIAIFSIALIFFGTNLFYYVTMQPAYSHHYSFALIAVFIYYLRKSILSFDNRYLFLLAFLYGLLIIIRPLNAIVLLSIFFLSDNWRNLKLYLKKFLYYKKTLIISLGIILILVFVQLLFYYLQSGQFILMSYKGYESSFLDPYMISVLFSYRKGMFIYTPVILFSFFGVFTQYKNLYRFFSLVILYIVIVYVISAWKIWHNADSYGMRKFIEYYAFFTLSLAFFIKAISRSKILRYTFLIIFSFLIFLNFFQIYQYNHYILHHNSMNKERYWQVFLKKGRRYYGTFYRPKLAKNKVIATLKLPNQFLEVEKHDKNYELFHSSPYSVKVDKKQKIKFEINDELNSYTGKSKFYRFNLYIYPEQINKKQEIIISVKDKEGKSKYWERIYIREFVQRKNTWGKLEYTRKLPNRISSGDELIIIIRTNTKLLIDDIEFKVFIVENDIKNKS